MPSSFRYKPVVCRWVDSCEPADNSDVPAEDFPTPQIITSLGWLTKSEPDYIVVAGAEKVDDHAFTTFDYVITIPRVAVLNLSEVSLPENV